MLDNHFGKSADFKWRRKSEEDVVIRTWKMELSGRRKIGKQKTEVERCYTKRPEGERSKERRSTIQEKMENENVMRRPQVREGNEDEVESVLSPYSQSEPW